jgi:hypothetical protein
MTAPTAKRADQLVVGDQLPDECLPYRFNKGPAVAVLVAVENEASDSHTFVAYRYPNGRHDSMTVRSEAVLRVFPGVPLGHDYSRADDDPEPTQPSAGRLPAHLEDGRTVRWS